MRENVILITGIPRSGTTMVCNLINSCDESIALVEPINVSCVNADVPKCDVLHYVESEIYRLRDRAIDGIAISRSTSENISTAIVPSISESVKNGISRSLNADLKSIRVNKSKIQNIAIKHNALFSALLPELSIKFEVCAIIRNPVHVLASWNTVDLPVSAGRLPIGESIDKRLKEKVALHSDVISRQIEILNWFAMSYRSMLPKHRVIRYECLLSRRATYLDQFVKPAVTEEFDFIDSSSAYEHDLIFNLGQHLLNSRGPIWDLFNKGEVEQSLYVARK